MIPTREPVALLAIERVTVTPERVEAQVRVAEAAPLRTSGVPGLASAVLALLPGLERHRCECGSAHGIVAELADTELPHLLEHVALELMVCAGSPRTLTGHTRWDFSADGHGVFRVSLEYDDDLVALAALREGAAVVSALHSRDEGGYDIQAAVGRVSAVRGR